MMKNCILFLVVLFYTGQVSFGAIEKFITRVDGNSGDLVVSPTSPTLTMYDDKYYQMATSTNWGFTNVKVKNVIRIGINPDVVLQSSSIPNGSVNLKILKWKWNSVINSFEFESELRTIDLINSTTANTDVINEIASYSFSDVHKIQIIVQSVSGISLSAIYLSAEAEVERYYNLNNNPVTGLSHSFFAGDPSNQAVQNCIRFDWDYKLGAECYELEWVHINSQKKDLSFYSPSDLKYNYYMNSTRVVVKGNSYSIPKNFDDGYIVYRVRPIGKMGALFNLRKEGVWTTLQESGTVASHGQNVIPINGEFQSQLNWSHQIAYADYGERFETVTYVDGLGRAHQSLGINTETNQTIVSNVYYDELGRPVVSDLPSPINGINLSQKDNFNQPESSPGSPYNYTVFDDPNSTVCDPVSSGFATSNGAGKYYSSDNTSQTGANIRVPDAEMFPFNRAVYTDDFTGRLKTTSGAGSELKTGSGHETQYFYPDVDQNEIDRLFGAEVGKATHYSKMVTIDPNGQIYIQIYDMAGRIVASYLAGENPQQLDSIEGNGIDNQTVELLPENSQAVDMTVPLATFSHLTFITEDANYNFVYSFTPSEFQDACIPQNLCLECIYDLNFKILDGCGKVIAQTTTTLNGTGLINVCGDETPYDLTFSKDLTVGEYQIVKTLSVSTQIMEDNWCLYLENNTCLSPVSSYFNQAYLLQTFPECTPELSVDDLNSCEEFLQIMLADLTPGGQYAEYNVDPNTGAYSIISGANSIFNPNGLGTGHDFQNPYSDYLDANGDISTVNGLHPEDLSLEMFISNFQPSWAYSLLNYHPEYCNYNLACNGTSTLTQSNDYDELLNSTYDYNTAFCNGYFKPLASNSGLYILPSVSCTTTTVNYDPFFGTGGLGATFASTMQAEMQNYNGSLYSIWQMAIFQAYCGGQGDIAVCLENFRKETSSCYNDLVWVTFRNMYLELKQGFVYQAIQGNCPVSPILTNGNHTAVFGDISDLPDADGDGNPEDGTGLTETEMQTYLADQASQSCQTQCTEYADEWLELLEGCDLTNLSVQQKNDLYNDLVNLCKSGCSSSHPFGSSTSSSGTTIQEVLDNYNITQTSICSGYLISEPLPYKSQEDMIAEVNVPLDTCACSVIHTAQFDIQNGLNNPNNFNLEQLIAVRTGASLEDAHHLLCACDLSNLEIGSTYIPNQTFWKESAANVFESTGIMIPANLGCVSENCTNCELVGEYYSELLSDFSQDPNFINSSNYSVILTNFMNLKLGFDLNFSDYDEFLRKCASSLTSPYCFVTDEALEWIEVMKLIAFRGSLTSNTAINLNAENIVYANSGIKDFFSGSDYWTSISGSTLTTNWGNYNGSNCSISLILSQDATFDFSDIISFDAISPLSENCGLMGDFIVSVTYIHCGELKFAELTGTSSCLNFVNCVCGSSGITLCDVEPDYDNVCYQPRLDELYQNAINSYQESVNEMYAGYFQAYKSACSEAFETEDLSYNGPFNNYQFTLFYYDQAGNLVKTVAPKGIPGSFNQANVNLARESVQSSTVYNAAYLSNPSPFPGNSYETTYKYNSYDQLVSTTNPDQIGETKYYYDRLGRMVASQNPVQADDKKYSYVLYDQYGRPVEVGQIDRDYPDYVNSNGTQHFVLRVDISEFVLKANDLGVSFKSWVYSCARTEVTYTIYDKQIIPAVAAKFASGTQENLRLRVASVVYFNAVNATNMPTSGYVSATHYSYDIHGNVIETLQDIPVLAPAQQDIKSTQYQFELLSGNVKKVEFQKGKRDQTTHEYIYDKMNRLTEVFTSTDGGVNKSREAHYRFFDYGPLARVEIGQHKVQGNDYSYTINGWIKSMNGSTLNTSRDAGRDGALGYIPNNSNMNVLFASDQNAYTLGYFQNDYKSIMPTSFEASVYGSTVLNTAIKQLYNGNIAYTTNAIAGFENQMSVYSYDQLQRIKSMTAYRCSTLINLNNWNDAASTDEYASTYSYDRNGNLTNLKRNGTITLGLGLDELVYNYDLNTNRLKQVTDLPNGATPSYGNQDIKGGQSSNNYTYDKLGQLTSDAQISNSYIWRKGDKKLRIQKSLTMQLEFVYNPFGQRVLKIEKAISNIDGEIIPQSVNNRWKYTYYAYDANGQVMATYKLVMDTTTTTFRAELDERMIYGAGRLGVIQETAELIYASNQTLSSVGPVYYNKLGKKNYELTNYLGNVNVVITDRKIVSSNTTVSSFKNSNDGWFNCTQSTFLYGDDALIVNFTGASNCVFKSLTTVTGKTYTISVKAAKGGTSGLRIKAFGSSLISTKNLDDNQNTIYQFTANSTTTNIIIEPIVYSGNSSYSIDEIAITPDYFYDAVAIMKADYYPFGMQMPARLDANGKVIGGSWQTDNYRYGYNGMEKDKELKGDGNSYTTEFRQYDPRLGRWLSLDPVIQPHQSPFSAMDNNPIMFNDPLGLKAEGWGKKENADGSTSWDYNKNITKDNYKTLGYTEYMDEGYLGNGTRRETGATSDEWYLNADGSSTDLNASPIGEVDILSSKTSTPAETPSEPVAEKKPSSDWLKGASLSFAQDGLTTTTPQLNYKDPATVPQWLRNRYKQTDNLALLAYGNMAAPFVAIGGAYAAITAPVWAPYAYQTTIQGARFYHSYFGMRGGYVNMAWNAGGQLSQAVADPQGYNFEFLSFGMSGFIRTPTAFSGGTSIYLQAAIGVGTSYLQVTKNGIETKSPFTTTATATAVNNMTGTIYSNSIYGNNGASLIINNGLIQPVINHFEKLYDKKK